MPPGTDGDPGASFVRLARFERALAQILGSGRGGAPQYAQVREAACLPRRRDRRSGAAGDAGRAGGGAGGRDWRRHRQPGAVHRAQGNRLVAAPGLDRRRARTDARPALPDGLPAGQALRLPLDAYASTIAETYLVEDAQDILMRRCMKDRCMEWKTLPLVDAQDTEPPNLRRYGADEVEALRHGYHPSPDPPSGIRRSRAWDAREALPAEMRRAACGPSGKGGCFKTADRQLAGDTAPPDFHAFNQLTGTALETSRVHPRSTRRPAPVADLHGDVGLRLPRPLRGRRRKALGDV